MKTITGVVVTFVMIVFRKRMLLISDGWDEDVEKDFRGEGGKNIYK